MIELKSPRQIQIMREAGRVVAEVIEAVRAKVKPGVTTVELDETARETIAKLGAQPAFKGYRGFPAHICTSVNEQVVHGIPSRRALKEGDIIGIDVGAVVEGYYGDAAVTVAVGKVSEQARELMRVTEEALERGIAMAKPGARLSDISHAVQAEVESHGFSVVREFVGHGIGTQLHEAPQIPNYGKPGYGVELKPGMVLAIEPMVTAGAAPVRVLEDGWTAVTVDGSLSAHFEHTVAIGEGGPEILTRHRG
ncbi:MAG: type I methionyl aminopeptidase [Candidatus Omnitrophica bacterium]|nr:type I methionyl aminopeptidase [Candidatus Omnitrophota bacterium]